MVTKRPNYLNFRRNFVSFGTIKHGAGTDLLFLVEHTKVDGMHNGTNDEGRGREGEKGLSYAGYVSHGGLINEADYQSALTRSRGAKVGDGARSQSEGIARFSGRSTLACCTEFSGTTLRRAKYSTTTARCPIRNFLLRRCACLRKAKRL